MMTQRTPSRVYEVLAERDGRLWFLRVNELSGVFSQVRRLDQAEGMARDAIAAFLDIPADGFDVMVTVKLPADLERDVAGVIDLRGAIDRTEREYAEQTRRLATRLVQGEGMTVREAGRLLGLSYQRVSQLVASV
ncbi:MAG: type II toxin-antitoxin system HicB family antitoxin [Actinomycetota bacterium]